MAKKPVFAKTRNMVTPIGTAVFPNLTKPDTEFSEDGVYRTKLALDPALPATQKMLEELDVILKEAVEAVKEATGKAKVQVHPLWTKEVVKDDDGNETETGNILINVKTNAIRKSKDGQRAKVNLKIVDSKRHDHPKSTPIYGGSRLRIAFWPRPNFTQGKLFLTLYITAVQVVELVTSNSDDFFDDEDGYEAATAAADSDGFSDESAEEEVDDDDDDDDSDMY